MTTKIQPAVSCSHPTLSLIECDDSFGFTCDGCQEAGYGSRYQCKDGCDYTVHEECAMASEIAHHHFFEQRPFTLQLKLFPNSSSLCTACGIAVTGCRYYHPLENGTYIFLHPCCMKIPHYIETDDGDKLFLKQQLLSLECGFCQRSTLEGPIKGWAYISADQKVVVHVRCVKVKKLEDYLSMYGQTAEEQEEEKQNEYDNSNNTKAVAPPPDPVQQVVYHQHHHHHYYVGQPSYQQQQQQYYEQHNYNHTSRKGQNSLKLAQLLGAVADPVRVMLDLLDD